MKHEFSLRYFVKREKALTIREFVKEILNDNFEKCLNLVSNKPMIVKSQISISILLSQNTRTEFVESYHTLLHSDGCDRTYHFVPDLGPRTSCTFLKEATITDFTHATHTRRLACSRFFIG